MPLVAQYLGDFPLDCLVGSGVAPEPDVELISPLRMSGPVAAQDYGKATDVKIPQIFRSFRNQQKCRCGDFLADGLRAKKVLSKFYLNHNEAISSPLIMLGIIINFKSNIQKPHVTL